MRAFLVHSNRDNVGVAIVEIKRGQTLRGAALDGTASTLQLTAVEGIPVGHKIALKDLKAGDTVMKYGEDIGRVVADIPRGAHVHVHNLKTKRWLSMQDLEFRGYRREDGRVGIRNHVVILPVDDISNAASDAVGRVIQGTLPLPHAYGRLQFGEDLELFFRTLIGVGSNPNVAAALVIGIEPGWTERVVQGIVKTGKPVMGFSIVRHGDLRTIAEVSRKAQEYVQWASELSTEECSMNEI